MLQNKEKQKYIKRKFIIKAAKRHQYKFSFIKMQNIEKKKIKNDDKSLTIFFFLSNKKRIDCCVGCLEK